MNLAGAYLFSVPLPTPSAFEQVISKACLQIHGRILCCFQIHGSAFCAASKCMEEFSSLLLGNCSFYLSLTELKAVPCFLLSELW